jgi:adenine-specific DNA-methyltransferase
MTNIQTLIGKSLSRQIVDTDKLINFKDAFKTLYTNVNACEERPQVGGKEDIQKGYFQTFLKTVLDNEYEVSINYDRIDLVLHENKESSSPISVIFELKSSDKKSGEMVSDGNLNVKALQELVLYYMQQRETKNQIHIQYLIALDFNDMFIFPAETFETNFHKNKELLKEFRKYDAGKLPSVPTTDVFYKDIASKYIANANLTYCHIPLRDYFAKHKDDDSKMSELYKVFSPETLLNKTVANDSNALNRKFYNELLYILGLEEKKDGSKTVLQRANKQPASLLEKTITVLKDNDKNIRSSQKFGKTYDERIYNAALELSILWLNRILFLKLLETQLYKYNGKDDKYKFLSFENIKYFDDFNTLFFSVFGKNYEDRDVNVISNYGHLPYLNSSLFEKSQLEWDTITMANLKDNDGLTLPIFKSSVLADGQTKLLPLIEYLLKFLDAYDFSSDKNTIASSGDRLINASVLGLIFEKINGYKDGAIFTPAYITQYISKFTIEKCVVDKFNKKYGWYCKDLTEVYNKIDNTSEANEIVNNLKILDPAVGSGHFLVSALNELIYIKYELGILCDEFGKAISRREYTISIENDEIVIKDSAGVFAYDKENKESRWIQKTIFNEKRRIIENCLFGVDINPNAVNICRLRLWIELLKNAYYKDDGKLETLPNIDINIKCGNSLVHRFDLDISVSKIMKRDVVADYKLNVRRYKETNDKNTKFEIEDIIKEIKTSFSENVIRNSKKHKEYLKWKQDLAASQAPSLFPLTPTEIKQKNKREKELSDKIAEYENKYKNSVYDNAMEWRFEFPEVLDADGNFEGFDCIIGNPPYIKEDANKAAFDGFREDSPYYMGKMDLWYGFACYGLDLLKDCGYLTFIAQNNWTTNMGALKLREKIVKDTRIMQMCDFNNVMVFDDASIQTMVMAFCKDNKTDNYSFDYRSLLDDSNKEDLLAMLEKEKGRMKIMTPNIHRADYFGKSLVFSENVSVLKIIEKNKIYFNDSEIGEGIVPALDRYFILKENELSRFNSNEFKYIKPYYTSVDERYYSEQTKKYLIYMSAKNFTENTLDNYPNLKDHFYPHEKELKEAKIKYKTPSKPYFFVHRERDESFFKSNYEKIVTQTRSCHPKFYYTNEDFYGSRALFFIKTTRWNMKLLTGILNSKLIRFWLNNKCEVQGKSIKIEKRQLLGIPLPVFADIAEDKVSSVIGLVDDIIEGKKNGIDTSSLEAQIDELVYEIYGLTQDEILIVENNA